ncbi:MAG: MraY family glycosyltransferase [Rhodocyclaceae bacterium]
MADHDAAVSLLFYPILAALITAITIAVMLRWGAAGPLDLPNQRSLHATPVPRSGGVGIMAGVMVGFVAEAPAFTFIAGLLLLTLVSWWDDRRSLPVAVRFACHFVAAGLVVAAVVPHLALWELLLALLFIVWMTNLYNFMDGANGLAGGMAVFGFGGYAVAAGLSGEMNLAVWAACIAAAAAGFLLFNFDPARIFMGDVGSIPLGFLATSLGLVGVQREVWPLWFPVLVFAPFIVDATVTLLRRAWRREKIWQAHREHYYQRLVRSGWSHRKLALHEYALMVAISASGCLMLTWPPEAQAAGLAVWLLVLGGLMRKIDALGRNDALP